MAQTSCQIPHASHKPTSLHGSRPCFLAVWLKFAFLARVHCEHFFACFEYRFCVCVSLNKVNYNCNSSWGATPSESTTKCQIKSQIFLFNGHEQFIYARNLITDRSRRHRYSRPGVASWRSAALPRGVSNCTVTSNLVTPLASYLPHRPQ